MDTDAIEAAGAGPLRQIIEEVKPGASTSPTYIMHRTNVCSRLPFFFFPRGWVSLLGIPMFQNLQVLGNGNALWKY